MNVRTKEVIMAKKIALVISGGGAKGALLGVQFLMSLERGITNEGV